MTGVFKLLLLSSTLFLVAFAANRRGKPCPEGQYKLESACFQCTPCADFLYEQEKCTPTSNTVCGWCGKKPNLDMISDEVLASYQSECLMAKLDFVDMNDLKNEYFGADARDDESWEEEASSEVFDDTDKKHFYKMAKDSLNQIEDSEEQELPDPTYEEDGRYYSSIEETDTEESSVEEMPVEEMPVEETSVEESSVEESSVEESSVEETAVEETSVEEADSENNTDETEEIEENNENYDNYENEENRENDENDEQDDPLNEPISARVEAYLLRKSKKTVKRVPLEIDDDDELQHGLHFLPRDEVEASLKHLVDLVPMRRVIMRRGKMFDSAEDSNERDIKWDKWLDDMVKPIKRVEFIEAEEVRQFDDIIRISPEIEENQSVHFQKGGQPSYTYAILFFFVGAIIIIALRCRTICVFNKTGKTFTGVPIHSQDYHMIVEGSKYVEKLEKKEKFADRHIHDNPVFDV